MSVNLSNLTMSRVSAGTGGSTPPPSGDPYWSSVSLLTETTGTNTQNNNVFLDGSSNARSFFTSGVVAQGAFSPFAVANGSSYSPATNGGSGYFVNGDVYVSGGPYALASDFTAECWFYRTDTGGSLQYIFAEQGSGNYFGVQSSGAVFGSLGGSMLFSDGAPVVTIGAWHHLVMVRSGSNVAAFVDGARVATATSSAAFQYQFIGGITTGNFAPNAYGYLSDCRIVNSAVYNPSNSTITVPTAPLTAISGTQLLMNFTNAGIYDAAAKNNMLTVADTQVSTTQAKFGTTSIKFDGTSDNLNFGTTTLAGDFTMECWFYQTAKSANYVPIISGSTGTYNFPLILDYQGSGKIGYYLTSGQNAATASSVFSMDTWNHLAMVRSGSTITVYLNGASILSTPAVTTSIMVDTAGGWTGAAGYLFNGYMQDVRITNGVARYTANFAAPTAAFLTY